MVPIDRLGRRRAATQTRGLRPLFPLLPHAWLSRALRIAMPEAAWAELDARAAAELRGGETRARALGRVLTGLMERAPAAAGARVHWLDLERDKAQRLLGAGGRAA
jgi:hypothetical protein